MIDVVIIVRPLICNQSPELAFAVPRLSEFRASFSANFAGIDAADGPGVYFRRGQTGRFDG